MVTTDKEKLYDSIIDNLFMVYYDKIDCELIKSKECEEKEIISFDLEKSFRETLSKEQEKEFYKLTQSIYNVNFSQNKGYFKEGFFLGAKLFLEIISSDTNN